MNNYTDYYAHTYIHVHTHAPIHVCIHVHAYTHTMSYIGLHIYLHIYTYISTCIHVWMHSNGSFCSQWKNILSTNFGKDLWHPTEASIYFYCADALLWTHWSNGGEFTSKGAWAFGHSTSKAFASTNSNWISAEITLHLFQFLWERLTSPQPASHSTHDTCERVNTRKPGYSCKTREGVLSFDVELTPPFQATPQSCTNCYKWWKRLYTELRFLTLLHQTHR